MTILSGGRSGIKKDGDRVIRPLKPWTKQVHGYLAFLHAQGFELVPKPLDNDLYDVVTFMEGTVHNGLLPDYVKSDDVLIAVARLLRSMHDLGTDYCQTLKGDETWMLPAVLPIETMCHGDLAPYNTVFSSETIQGIIDFDTLHPGPRLWDLAYVAYRWVPLMSQDNPEDFKPDDRMRRLKLLLDSYGMDIGLLDVLDWTKRRLNALMAYMKQEADKDNLDVMDAIDQGHLATYARDLIAIEQMRKAML